MKTLTNSEVENVVGGTSWDWLNDIARSAGSALAGAVDYAQSFDDRLRIAAYSGNINALTN